MAEDFYGEVAAIYDRMIRWERRLQFEEPLFAALWQRSGARTLLDASCGSGRHLPLFVRQGLRVSGADASAAMLELARAQVDALPEAERPRLVHAAWAELPEKLGERFDAVLCLGNSLPYVTEPAALRESLRGLWSAVAPGGFLLVQFRNFARMRRLGERFLPLSSLVDPASGAEYLCLRQYDWHPASVDFLVIMCMRERPDPALPWTLRHWSTPLATYGPADVTGPLEELGAQCELYGSLALAPRHLLTPTAPMTWSSWPAARPEAFSGPLTCESFTPKLNAVARLGQEGGCASWHGSAKASIRRCGIRRCATGFRKGSGEPARSARRSSSVTTGRNSSRSAPSAATTSG